MPLDRYKAAGDQLGWAGLGLAELGWAGAGAGDLIRRAGGDTTVYSLQSAALQGVTNTPAGSKGA